MWTDKIQKIDIPYIQVHTGIYILYKRVKNRRKRERERKVEEETRE